MIIDNRYHFRMTPARYQALPCPEAFLLKRPLIKTPATEEAEAVYYTLADNLTIEQAIGIYYAQTGSGKLTPTYYIETGDNPESVATIEEADRVVFSLWSVYGSELRAFIGAIESLGENPDEVLIPSGSAWNNYISSKELPV